MTLLFVLRIRLYYYHLSIGLLITHIKERLVKAFCSALSMPQSRNPYPVSYPMPPFRQSIHMKSTSGCLIRLNMYRSTQERHASIQPCQIHFAGFARATEDQCPHQFHFMPPSPIITESIPASRSPRKKPTPKFPMPSKQPSCPHPFHAAIAQHSASPDHVATRNDECHG
mmetsp:Transcript_30195/g.52273  ORF Transcript_30195/g.52273 Transcript_30195/m.52273 type:complete len:170 (+) Transcript_30195:140-649(+)